MKTCKSSSTGWCIVALEEVVTRLTNGYVGPTRDIYLPKGIPYLLARHIKDNKLTFDGKTFISPQFNCKHSKSILKEGDVLMVQSGHIGETAVVPKEHEGHNCHALIIISPKQDKLLGSYLSYYFNSIIGRRELEKFETGITLKHLNCKDVRTVKIPLPPLEEQKRIAAIAQKADRLRRTRRYALQLSDTYVRSVFLEMFGDFLQINTKNKFKDVLEIPLSNGVFEKNENYGCGTPVIWVDNLYHTISIDTSRLRKAKLDNKSIQKYEVLEGDLLFTRSSLVREGTGQINIVPKLSERTTFECHTIRARINKQLVNPYYILGLYGSSYGRNLIMQRANTATMTTIGQEGIEELLCPIPPLPLQEKFAQIVQKFDRLRTQQREAYRQAEHLFQTLLHRAFRGELTSQNADDEPESVLLEEIPAQQAKAEAKAKTATQAMGEAADYLGTKAKQQDIEPIQLKFPGFE
ncbi:restriction endonuclease subunit S [Microcoleus vaginatus]|uniref:restriction endonuclease subunit S n=1 Tax=Microcoleus vaginatus TaxID=119532 RepID=UPI001688D529|nr:restriction endonuclease subunit S [Microcoleus sp. FACHB-84]MBD2009949.1 restriction endonuclease subunit S [Microcoleus sp. FACHB-45]